MGICIGGSRKRFAYGRVRGPILINIAGLNEKKNKNLICGRGVIIILPQSIWKCINQ